MQNHLISKHTFSGHEHGRTSSRLLASPSTSNCDPACPIRASDELHDSWQRPRFPGDQLLSRRPWTRFVMVNRSLCFDCTCSGRHLHCRAQDTSRNMKQSFVNPPAAALYCRINDAYIMCHRSAYKRNRARAQLKQTATNHMPMDDVQFCHRC